MSSSSSAAYLPATAQLITNGQPFTALAIAFFRLPNRPKPQWALVAHENVESDFYYTTARVYQILPTDNREPSTSYQKHVSDIPLATDRTLIGIFKLGIHPFSLKVVDDLVRTLPAGRNGDDPAGVDIWGPAGWVIRVLGKLNAKHSAGMPYGIYKDMYTYASAGCARLMTMAPLPRRPFPVIEN